MNISDLFFISHYTGIIFTNIGWIYYPKVLFIHPIVILSWKLNNNKCIISQLEYYLFKRTFLGNGEKYYVPKYARYIFYLNFITGLIFNHPIIQL